MGFEVTLALAGTFWQRVISSCQRHFRGDGSQTVCRTMSGRRQIHSCGLVVHVFLGLVCRLYLRMSLLEKAFFSSL